MEVKTFYYNLVYNCSLYNSLERLHNTVDLEIFGVRKFCICEIKMHENFLSLKYSINSYRVLSSAR